jgi:hypothetical protein
MDIVLSIIGLLAAGGLVVWVHNDRGSADCPRHRSIAAADAAHFARNKRARKARRRQRSLGLAERQAA